MTEDQKLLIIEILRQNDTILEINFQLIQTIAPLEMIEEADDEPSRTLQ